MCGRGLPCGKAAQEDVGAGFRVFAGAAEGFDAPDAMIAVGLGTITMADAVSIRRAAGEHARLLNRIAARLDASERFEAARLRERLGHTRREVIAGVFFGIAVALGVCGFWDFWK